MVCDYSNYTAKQFIQNITSNKMYQCFDIAEQSLNGTLSRAEKIHSEANRLLQKAKARHNTCLNDIKEFSGKVDDAKRKLKNTPLVRPAPRIGLDGKVVTDKYGNVQQVFYNNPDYAETQKALADATIKLEAANREREWASAVIDKANKIISTYSSLIEAIKSALQSIEWARSSFKDKIEKIADLAKKAMTAAEDALSVNIHNRTVVRYQSIPSLRKE